MAKGCNRVSALVGCGQQTSGRKGTCSRIGWCCKTWLWLICVTSQQGCLQASSTSPASPCNKEHKHEVSSLGYAVHAGTAFTNGHQEATQNRTKCTSYFTPLWPRVWRICGYESTESLRCSKTQPPKHPSLSPCTYFPSLCSNLTSQSRLAFSITVSLVCQRLRSCFDCLAEIKCSTKHGMLTLVENDHLNQSAPP